MPHDYSQDARSPRTLVSDRTAGRRFWEWAQKAGHPDLIELDGENYQLLGHIPVPVVRDWLNTMGEEGLRPSSIQRYFVSIAAMASRLGQKGLLAEPLLKNVLKGLRRVKGAREVGRRAIYEADLRKMVATLGDDLLGLRGKALLWVGFTGAFRRSELVAVRAEHLTLCPNGNVEVFLPVSKANQLGQKHEVKVLFKGSAAIVALRAWLRASSIKSGYIFRDDPAVDRPMCSRGVLRLVHQTMRAAGLDDSGYGAHSLRAGFVTELIERGVPDAEIRKQTGQSASTLKRYVRPEHVDHAAGNAARFIGNEGK